MTKTTSGIGLWTALFLILFTLKLTEVIDWSWWWVTAPLWLIPVTLMVGLFIWFMVKSLIDAFSKGNK